MRNMVDPADSANVLAGVALVLLPIAILAPLGIAPLAGVAALLVFGQQMLARRRWPDRGRSAQIAITIFILWGALTALWSLDPAKSLGTAFRVGVICLGGILLVGAARDFDVSQRNRVARALAIGTLIGAAMLAFEFATGFSLTRLLRTGSEENLVSSLNRAASLVVLLCWPIAIIVHRRWRSGGVVALLVATVIALMQFDPEVPLVALASSTIVFVFALQWPRKTALALGACIAITVLAIPTLPDLAPRLDSELTTHNANENSISHRLGIWAFSSKRVLEQPFTGWGLGASRAVPGGTENVLVRGQANPDAPAIPLHPHNATIQLWLEAGLPALLIAAFVVVRALLTVPGAVAGRFAPAALLGTGTAVIVVANLSYGIWQGWWLCTIWLILALSTALVEWTRSERSALS